MVEKKWELALGLLMILVVAALAGRGFEAVRVSQAGAAAQLPGQQKEAFTVVIDAGHGGMDPGKVGVNEILEKEINLQIAQKLKSFLEAADVQVVLTRKTDAGLYEETDGNKKIADMKARCRVIDESGADIVVSIHQNSFHDPSVKGAQVFYYTHSEEGKKLAEEIQAGFTGLSGTENTRQAKGNTDYYLLLHAAQPIVIVECGFLSNPDEASKLKEEEYQEKVAWVIHLGILRYLNQK